MMRDLWEVATVENTLDIAAPAEELFDFVVDVRNEPRWNPQMLQVQMLTSEPVRAGTTFRVIFGRGVGEAVIEDTKVDRPHSWTAVSRSRVLDVESEGQILDVPGGSRLIMRSRLRPRGTLRLLTPALGWWMHRTWEQDLRRVKALLEHDTSTVSEPGPTADESIERVPVPDLCALWAETSTAPMNIALIGAVEAAPLVAPDGTVALDRIRSFVGARLPRAPMLLRTLRLTRLGQGTPAWIDAPHFDIADHVILAPADRSLNHENDLLAWCARRSLIPLERTRPLWRLDIIPGLPGGRLGVLLVLHHVVADGLRGVALVTSLLDSTPQGRGEGAAWHPKPAPAGFDLVRDNVRRRWDAIRRFRPSRLVRSARTMRALSHAPGRRAPSTSLTGPIADQRHLAVLRYPIAELRAAAHAHGCTINDLLIAAVTTGLRDLLNGRGENQDRLELLASVPVGARGGSEGGMFIAPLPVGVADGAERLRIITQATATGKRRPDQGVAGIVAMPASLARLGVAWAKRAATSHINLYVTNVPGPTSTLYFAGARLLQAVPLAPLVAGVRLSVTAMSYDGHFAVSLLADNNMPDLPVLAAGVRTAFESYINAYVSSDSERERPPAAPTRPRY
ncbi:MAG TPA: wax ester/triacylglycerol synthase domain-containing protein [Propionibacteriaceae bacterium]